MGFLTGMEEERRQERALRGSYRRAAVGCWFTASGKAMPLLAKVEDEDGSLQMVREIRVLKTDQKFYGGILMRRYDCCGVINDREMEFTLLYHPDTGRWDMVV